MSNRVARPNESNISDMQSFRSRDKSRDLSYFNNLHLTLDKLRIPKRELSSSYNKIP